MNLFAISLQKGNFNQVKKPYSLKSTMTIWWLFYTGLLRLQKPWNKRGKYKAITAELSKLQQFTTFYFGINWRNYILGDVSRSYKWKSMLEEKNKELKSLTETFKGPFTGFERYCARAVNSKQLHCLKRNMDKAQWTRPYQACHLLKSNEGKSQELSLGNTNKTNNLDAILGLITLIKTWMVSTFWVH